MPKYRQLHAKIIDSFDFNEMPDDFTRVVWLLLPLILDSEGRGIDNMAWVKSKMFPLRDDIKIDKIANVFSWLSDRKMLICYQTNGRDYFYVPTFKTYQSGTQKEAASMLPGPELVRSKSGVGPEEVSVAESASASESEFESADESESVLTAANNIFQLYENSIGTINKTMADILGDAEKLYKHEWVEYAFKECVSQNKRSWSYVEAILKNCGANGCIKTKSKQQQSDNIKFDNSEAINETK